MKRFTKYCKKKIVSCTNVAASSRAIQVAEQIVVEIHVSRAYSNPTYNSVRLQEGKLRVARTQIHVYIRPQAPASVDYTDSPA